MFKKCENIGFCNISGHVEPRPSDTTTTTTTITTATGKATWYILYMPQACILLTRSCRKLHLLINTMPLATFKQALYKSWLFSRVSPFPQPHIPAFPAAYIGLIQTVDPMATRSRLTVKWKPMAEAGP